MKIILLSCLLFGLMANTVTYGENIMNEQKAQFGAGCFWGVEAAFRKVEGVLDATVGYSGGRTKNPAYKEVCSGNTGHAEVVNLIYDPKRVSYQKLLNVFWDIHDPTTKNRQGPDVGSQYRSAIFYYTPEQQQIAQESLILIERSGAFKKPIVTEIVPANVFYKAEEYHQRYHEKHGGSSCHF